MKLERLRSPKSFQVIHNHGSVFFKQSMVVKILRKPDNALECAAAFAVIASRKVGNAVQRNRCKRRLREVARQVLKGQSNLLLVLIAKKSTLTAVFSDLVKDLDHALSLFLAKENA